MKKVFLFSGKMGSGKNQFAEYISEIYRSKGLKVVSDLFAADLKQWSKEDFKILSDILNNIGKELQVEIMVIQANRKAYGLPDDGVIKKFNSIISKLFIKDENWFENKTDITRALLQIYGTNIFRNRIDNDFWIKRTKERVLNYDADVVCITDVRFPNEIEYMGSQEYRTYAIRINRPIDRQGHQHEHISETALDNYTGFNYIINNNAGLDHLKECAYGLISDIERIEKEFECQLQ